MKIHWNVLLPGQSCWVGRVRSYFAPRSLTWSIMGGQLCYLATCKLLTDCITTAWDQLVENSAHVVSNLRKFRTTFKLCYVVIKIYHQKKSSDILNTITKSGWYECSVFSCYTLLLDLFFENGLEMWIFLPGLSDAYKQSFVFWKATAHFVISSTTYVRMVSKKEEI